MSGDRDIERQERDENDDARARESAPGEPQPQSETWGVSILRADLSRRASRKDPPEPERQERKIPQTRVGRSAKLGTAIGTQATRYAGTVAANVARSEESSQERLESRHLETALKMASVLGEMKGAAMKIGQMASFIDVDFLPPEYREIYQEQLSKLRTSAPAMPWEKVERVLAEEYEDSPERVFASIEQEAFAAASIGQVHRATLHDGTPVAVKVQYPGIADALESDVANAGILVRLARVLAPGLDAKAVAAELRERVLEELDYEFEAQNQRAFARAYDGHPFIFVPKVHSRLSRRRVLVSDYVQGRGFDEVKELEQDERDIFGEIVFRFCFGSIYHLQHFNADTHPGNYVLMDDGRVAFLDFGMTKRLTQQQIQLEQRAVDAAGRDDPERLRDALHDLGFVNDKSRVDAERLMEHVKMVGGWYLQDGEVRITPKRVMKMIEVTSDPRSDFFDLVRKESLPADELMGRRMETGLLAVLAQLRATANWHRIMREWVYADPPSTVLGEAEWRYFERRGTLQTPGLATRA
jgi:predicted unusual protein kinase regulating ubiquinone biosynthesis (AarF/ABC1/UbiB family)